MSALDYLETPLQELHYPSVEKAGLRVLIKREDLNHPSVSGNKWWKLKYNIVAAHSTDHKTILTFGGAFSNHIFATSAAAKELGLRSIGVIRGENHEPLNDTLRQAADNGMQLHYVTRDDYRQKSKKETIDRLHEKYGEFYLIPEGGSNREAVKGCDEFAQTVLSKITCDYICLPVGTGGTIAGIISAFYGNKKIIGVPVLKNGKFLADEIQTQMKAFSREVYSNWSLLTDYHHGGYAKVTPSLLTFIAEMNRLYNLPLDRVYTGKLVWAIMREIESGNFPRGSTILLLHTGGLQGSSTC
jgi:1-aminocyclopropane-1-carboxylate deaminase/D-cysteine desulfhydrase-like pyridoxal-dependent ACC family enzyme